MGSSGAARHHGAPSFETVAGCGFALPAAGAIRSIPNVVEWVDDHAQDAPHDGKQ